MRSVRQLLVISSLVIACILVGMLAVGTSLMERKLDSQLQTDSENTAATLSLLVSAQSDPQGRTAVLDAAFQQGRFARLSLRDAGGAPLFEAQRRAPAHFGTPSWFVRWTDIPAHHARRIIQNVGQLDVTLDQSAAREALWAHVVQWTWLACGIGAFWALFVVALLARVRKALLVANTE